MMILIPLGHDKGIHRFPTVTVSIIVLCFGVQAYQSFGQKDDKPDPVLLEKTVELKSRLWKELGPAWLKQEYPQLFERPVDHAPLTFRERRQRRRESLRRGLTLYQARKRFFEELSAGKISPGDARVQKCLQLEKQLMDKGFSVERFAYGPTRPFYTLITYAFVHGGWLHLIGNMLFLYLCGCNLEDRWGRLLWLFMYLGGAVLSALLWGHYSPISSVGLVGASGAIAAAMGAFLIALHSANIRLFYAYRSLRGFGSGIFETKAYWALPLWLISQLFGMVSTEAVGISPVAYSAHVGGFAWGLFFGVVMRISGLDARLRGQSEREATTLVGDPRLDSGFEQLDQGNRSLAKANFEAVLKDDPNCLAALTAMLRLEDSENRRAELAKRAVMQSAHHDPQAALAFYADHLKSAPDTLLDDRVLLSAALAFEKAENAAGAVEVYQRLVSLCPESPLVAKAMLNAARQYRKLAHHDEAKLVLHQIIELYPGTPYADQAEQLLRSVEQ
jgi:membrane associated rhomboid family serine protease